MQRLWNRKFAIFVFLEGTAAAGLPSPQCSDDNPAPRRKDWLLSIEPRTSVIRERLLLISILHEKESGSRDRGEGKPGSPFLDHLEWWVSKILSQALGLPCYGHLFHIT